MTVPVTTRPLPLNTILSVAGISFHQDVAVTLRVGQELVLAHTPENRYDANAVEVRTTDGNLLGHVPAAVAGRLAGALPNGRWRAKVHEVLVGETTGVRLFLGPPVGVGTTPGTDGLRHTDDGYTDDDATTGTSEPAAEPAEQTSADAAPVMNAYTRGGRLLGVVTAVGPTKTTVLTAAGVTAAYPNTLIACREP